MPLTKFEWAPGIQKDDTPLVSEGGWTDADKIRFVRKRPQTIGGWDYLTAGTFSGIARGAHAWSDVAGYRYLAFGTAAKLYLYDGDTIRDITPVTRGVLSNPFTTSIGSPIVVVTDVDHGLASGQVVTFSNQSSPVGGLTLNGNWTVTVLSKNAYQITAPSNATANVSGGGGNVDFSYPFLPGNIDGRGVPGGFGAGAYGEGGYGGTIASANTKPRVWSLANFGQSLVAVPRGGPLFEYQPARINPATGKPDNLVSNGGFDTTASWGFGVGWSVGAGTAVAAAGTASDLVQNIGTIEAGAMYEVTFTVVRTAGTVSFKAGNPATAVGDASLPISASGTYSRLFRAPPSASAQSIWFSKDATFAGSIDNISMTLAPAAYRVTEAPLVNEGMFVDPNGIVVLFGTSNYLDTYNPMSVRWSDLQNITAWTPSPDNLAGDAILSTGGLIVGGCVSRTQNLLWTDVGIYTMQYTGDAAEPFTFRLAGTGCGLIGLLARCEHNGIAYWMGRDALFMFQGVAPVQIPCGLKRDLFDNIAPPQVEKTVAGAVSAFNEIWWFYPDKRDGREVSRYISFTLEDGVWSCGTFNRTSWVGAGVYEHPVGFGTDGHIYAHERGESAVGAPLASFLDAAYVDIEDGHTLTYVRRLVPDFEGQKGAVTFDVFYKRYPNAPEVHKGAYIAAENTEKLDFRLTARQIKLRLSANSSPSFWRLGCVRADVLPTGQLR
jgi:hypothetical protein